MALTEKGMSALGHIKTHFPTGAFSAKDLSDAAGEKIVAATLNAVANNGYLNKLGGSPVQYEAVSDLLDLMENMSEVSTKIGQTNVNMASAKRNQNDEFYTRYDDIEAEVMKYRKQFRGKIVYLPCDDPAEKKSEFWSFFVNNFDAFGLKKLIATHYDENGKAYKIWIDGDTSNDGYIDDADALQEDLEGNGDFRSPECIAILKECDIVCTNPPFSVYREFFAAIMQANKQFLIICPQNAFKYKDIFPYVKEGMVWAGYSFNKTFDFIMSDDYVLTKTGYIDDNGKKHGKVAGTCWMTNMVVNRRVEEMVLTHKYNPFDYPQFDTYDAINVSRVDRIPCDYDGIMGVPITFLGKHNPDQFEIVGEANHGSDNKYDLFKPIVNGKELFPRILIRRKK